MYIIAELSFTTAFILSTVLGAPPAGTFKLTQLSYQLRPNDFNGQVSVDASLGEGTDVLLQWNDLVSYNDKEFGLPIMGGPQKFTYMNQWYNSQGSFKQSTLYLSPVPHYPNIPLKLVAETLVPHLKYDINFNLPTSQQAYRPSIKSLRELTEVVTTPGSQIHVKRGSEDVVEHLLELTVKPGSRLHLTYTEGLPGDLVNPTQTYDIDDWDNMVDGSESTHLPFSGNLQIRMTKASKSFGMKMLSFRFKVTGGVDAASGQYVLHVESSTDIATSHAEVCFEVLEKGKESRFPASPVRMTMSTATEPEGVDENVTWELGHPDVIYCTGYSYPPPHLLLIKDGWPVGSGAGHYLYITNSADHATLTFIIQQVDSGFSGTYECVASSNDGQEFSKTVNIEVV